jgi:hypothetical protein
MALSRTSIATTQTLASATSTISTVALTTGDLLVVSVACGDAAGANAVTGITWNSIALTKAVESNGGLGGSDEWNASSIWYLKIASGTTANIVITCAGTNTSIHSVCQKYTGHDTTTPIGDTDALAQPNVGTGFAASLTLTTSSGDDVLDVLAAYAAGGGYTVGAGQTLLYDATDGNDSTGKFSREAASGASVTMSWTDNAFNTFNHVAAVVKVASGGATVKPWWLDTSMTGGFL